MPEYETYVAGKENSDYEAMLAGPGDPAVSERVADDEAHFLDRAKTRFFIVDERTEH